MRPSNRVAVVVVARSYNSVMGTDEHLVKSWDSYNKWVARQPGATKKVHPDQDIAIIELVDAVDKYIKPAILPEPMGGMSVLDFSGVEVVLPGMKLSEDTTYDLQVSEHNLVVMKKLKCLERLSDDGLGGTPIWKEVRRGSVLCTQGPPTLSQNDAGGAILTNGNVVIGVNRLIDSRKWENYRINFHINISLYMDFIISKIGCKGLKLSSYNECALRR
ncbi:hypothetical protein QAD02_010889 [Eretmocerus hayati]|uniref:Uncharacterized protein n=1 Tax=Eretmocerus hayati TaxID=131215 RepID=A0ACC2NW64_9HYME|nr:hypothetical protein QAD02_010889 [Eretmocerus hayati]